MNEPRRGDCVYRKCVGRDGKGRSIYRGYYRARYIDAKGEQQDHVIVLANGKRVRDKPVAQEWLRQRIQRIEREAVGLIDPQVEAARLPIRVVLARFVRHLRRHRKGREVHKAGALIQLLDL